MLRCIRLRIFAAGLVFAALGCLSAHACNTPVFRYALERWMPDSYTGVLLRHGELNAAQKSIADRLQNPSGANRQPANFGLFELDISKGEDYYGAAVKDLPAAVGEKTGKLAKGETWLYVYLAMRREETPALWQGKLEDAPVEALLDSPLRRELARRLLKGDSAVWLFLESGDRANDQAAEKVIDEALKQIEKDVELPPREEPPEGAPPAPELRVKFSRLNLARDIPGEALLLRMLLAAHPNVKDAKEPAVFPVFGRGRVLDVIVGKDLNADMVLGVARFLCGPCSCEVKDQNPGHDLLISADWENLIVGHAVIDKALPPLTGLGELTKAAENTEAKTGASATVGSAKTDVTQITATSPPALPAAAPASLISLGALCAVVLLIVLAVTATVILRSKGT